MSAARRSLVIGAGVVGLCCARALLREGYAVTVIDRDPAGDKASFGNAGGLGVTEILPAAMPGSSSGRSRAGSPIPSALCRSDPRTCRAWRPGSCASCAARRPARRRGSRACWRVCWRLSTTICCRSWPNSGWPATCTASARSGSTTRRRGLSAMRRLTICAVNMALRSRRSASPRPAGWSQR